MTEHSRQLATAKHELEVKQQELEAKRVEVVVAQQQLEEVVLEKADTVVQKNAFISKLFKTVDEKEDRHNIWSDTHGITVVRTNDSESKRPYYIIRRKLNDMSRTISKIRVKHPNSDIIYRNRKVTNPINLYHRLKACGILTFNGNYYSSLVGEAELIGKLHDLCTIVKPELSVCKRLQDM
jgi:hypothetical protein